MKISDLMIGDIVTFKECQNDEAPMPIKIVALGFQNDDEDTALAQIGRNTEGCDIIGIDDEIVGIPLTSEILEKNRFKPFKIDAFSEAKNCIGKWWYKGGDIFVKQYCLDHESYRKGHTVFTLGWHPHSRVCNIRYVHELQHAMKLCKIDKEIVL